MEKEKKEFIPVEGTSNSSSVTIEFQKGAKIEAKADSDSYIGIGNLGNRYNEGKPRWSLVDFKDLEGMVKVLEFGAMKYADHNWRKGLPHTEIVDSLVRHITAYLNGEDLDQESGLRHIDHMMCNTMFLSRMDRLHPGLDTRYKERLEHIANE